ncbi:MAG: hypothetical protein OXC55_02695 [Chloroflexi bacterium]|nr:hypothetical protein [Chloroflexota bacterium]
MRTATLLTVLVLVITISCQRSEPTQSPPPPEPTPTATATSTPVPTPAPTVTPTPTAVGLQVYQGTTELGDWTGFHLIAEEEGVRLHESLFVAAEPRNSLVSLGGPPTIANANLFMSCAIDQGYSMSLSGTVDINGEDRDIVGLLAAQHDGREYSVLVSGDRESGTTAQVDAFGQLLLFNDPGGSDTKSLWYVELPEGENKYRAYAPATTVNEVFDLRGGYGDIILLSGLSGLYIVELNFDYPPPGVFDYLGERCVDRPVNHWQSLTDD